MEKVTIDKCPFCGSKGVSTMEVDRQFKGTHRHESTYAAECFNCGARGPKSKESREKAIELWNRD